jgi:hypothetical protein
MTATTIYRYQLPKKSIKSDCPACGPKHRRTLSRYIDTRTGEPLPDEYGKCDRESNCGYHLSPYHKSPAQLSYADQVYEQEREQWASGQTATMNRKPITQPASFRPSVIEKPRTIISIPGDLFQQSLGHYERNQLAHLLHQHFGIGVADDLLKRFNIGTSARWPGACIFWYVDEQGRIRGGQIKQFGNDWHTVKFVDKEGRKRTRTDWVHSAYAYTFDSKRQPRPTWLEAYIDQKEFSPCLFGLPQLLTAPADQPVAIVEAPKTAILCTAYFPQFIWLAVGSLSYLNVRESGLQRMEPLRNRSIVLFPDLSKGGTAYSKWNRIAEELRAYRYQITVSDYLEEQATDEEKVNGLDLADYILDQWKGYPPDWDTPARNDW